MRTHSLLGVLATAALAGAAGASTDLSLDVNSLTMQSVNVHGVAGAFGGVNHTGAVVLTNGAASALAGVMLDGVSQHITSGLTMVTHGEIELFHGAVTGGFLSVAMSDGSMFNALIAGGEGKVTTQVGQGFKIDGLLMSAGFSDSGSMATKNKFAGVVVAPFKTDAPILGTFLSFAFNPTSRGFDPIADLDISVATAAVPLPGAGLMGAAGVLGLGATRRRRA